jgi:putative serine protease PepD
MTGNAFPPPPPPFPPHPGPPADASRRRGGRVVGAAVLAAVLAGSAAGYGAATLTDDESTTDAATSITTGQQPLDLSPGNDSAATEGSTEAAATEALPSVVKIYASSNAASGTGSGIVLTENGEILTNNHVVEVAASGGNLAVSFSDGTTAAARILGTDPLTDLAVIKADDVSGLTPATLGDSDLLDVGEEVVAVGAPFGLESTVTTGIVSALNRPVSTQGSGSGQATVFPAIQTDAAINPGNSGGPLINLSGEVVGIDSAIRTGSSSVSSQGGSIGLGFAIPINDAIPIIEQLRDGKQATHALIGVSVGDAQDKLGLPGGALVGEVTSGSAAAESDLKAGDVITAVDNHDITDSDTLVAIVRTYRPGDTVTLTVTGSTSNGTVTGDTHEVKLTLGSDAD